jgi:hypothetical protein
MDDIAADTEYVKLKHLVPDPANPNRRESIVDIKDSLRAFGQDQDLVIQRGSNRIIKGNHRYKAMVELGWVQGRVKWVDDDDLTATRRGLADNRISEGREFDGGDLMALLDECGDELPPGFTPEYIEDLKAKYIPDDLDALQDKYGDPDDTDFWPTIRIKVPPDINQRWEDIRKERDSDYEAMAYLLEHV